MVTELLSIDEVAKLFHLHQMTVRRHIRNGKLRAIKVGGRIRVRRDELERFVQPLPADKKSTRPSTEPPSLEEIQRRRVVFDQILRVREQIGPVGVSADELIRQVRSEAEESHA